VVTITFHELGKFGVDCRRQLSFNGGVGAPRISKGKPVAKELRTAEQLSDLIVAALGISEVYIRVRKDHAYGWQPTVVSSPGDSIGYQRRVDEIANRLRFQFDLRE
jgi:hypothetical protein